jgi:SAM-dependent methyltransferase
MDHELPDKYRLKLLAKLASGEVLDVGCHDVQNPYLARAVGFDLKRPATLEPHYHRFVEGDCQAIDSFFEPASFDTIIAGEVIEHLENPSSFLRGCHVILKDTGRLMLTTPNPYHWTTVIGNMLFMTSGIPYEHVNLFPFRVMVAILSNQGWRISEVRKASAGLRLWSSTRKFFLPCPKAFAWQHLYICEKK